MKLFRFASGFPSQRWRFLAASIAGIGLAGSLFLLGRWYLASGSQRETRIPSDYPKFSYGIKYPKQEISIGFAATECMIRLPPGSSADFRIFWNDRDVTAQFSPFGPRPRQRRGGWRVASELNLLEEGRVGENTLEVRKRNGDRWESFHSVMFRFDPYPLRVDFTIEETDGSFHGDLFPARLTFHGIDGTSTPNFMYLATEHHKTVNRIPFVVSMRGTGSVLLPEGEYEALASRGPEYTVSRAVIRGRGRQQRDFRLKRVVDTSGYLSADFHAHSILSVDNHVPLALRAVSFAAAGVEFLVMTDHNALTDLSPVLRELGLEHWLTSAVGIETSITRPGRSGHWNVFPFLFPGGYEGVPYLLRPRVGNRPTRPYEMYDWLWNLDRFEAKMNPFSQERGRELLLEPTGARRLIQLNHPRSIQYKAEGWKFGHFDVIGFDPECVEDRSQGKDDRDCQAALFRSSPTRGTSNLDFDLLELYNRTSLDLYRKVRKDWFWLLNRGWFKVATANTDSHSLFAGYPRNFVRVGASRDRPGNIPIATVFAALQQGANMGSTGPFIHFSATEAGREKPVAYLGDQLHAPSGKIRLRLRVEAAPWVPVEEVRIYINGEVTKRFHGRTDPGLSSPTDPFGEGPVVRLETELELSVTRDSWIVVEAGGKESGKEEKVDPLLSVYRRITQVESPIAFTNPIFIDVESN